MRPYVIPLLFLLLAACRTLAPSGPAAPRTWISINRGLPTHAAVLALAAETRTLYAATYDTVGLYTSQDDARTWQADTRGLPVAPVLSLLAEPGGMLAGTAAGLFQRAPAQSDWTRVESIPPVAVYALTRGPGDALYASTDAQGIYIREGNGWTRVPGLEGEIILTVLGLDRQTLLAGTSGHGLFSTRDGGRTWQHPSEFEGDYISMLALDPGTAETIYLRTRGGLYRSHDAGGAWDKLSGGIESEIVHALAFDPAHGRILAASGGHGVLLSDDDGAHWRVGRSALPEGRAVLALLSRGATIMAGTVDGVYLSEDGGETWTAAGEGIGAPQLHVLALRPGDESLLLASDDGLYQSSDQGATWSRLAATVLDLPVLSVAAASNPPGMIYAGTFHRGVWVSDDGGSTWTAAGGELGERASVAGLAVHPRDPQTVFARALYSRLYKSTDGGDNWHSIWTGMPLETEVETMAIDPENPQQMYAGSSDRLYASSDGGESWQARGLEGVSTLALWIDSHDSRQLRAGTTDGLYQSDDAGENWQPVALTHVTVMSLVRDPRGCLYAGTKYDGAFVSDDGGKTFMSLGTGLEGMSVASLVLAEGQGILYAVTDRGVFKYVVRGS